MNYLIPNHNVTELEIKVLRAFFDSEFGDVYDDKYEEFGTCVWMFSIKEHSGLDGKTFSGVVSSLVKKGLVETETEGDHGMRHVKIEDTYTMSITEDGWDRARK